MHEQYKRVRRAGSCTPPARCTGRPPGAAGDKLPPCVQPHSRLIEKPWGWELLWAEEPPHYAGKLLHIEADKRLSLQYHDEKLETQFLLSGRALLILENGDGALAEIEMEPGKGYTIQPCQPHRLAAITDAEIMEVSTPETGATFRHEDDHARPDETEELRQATRVAAPAEGASITEGIDRIRRCTVARLRCWRTSRFFPTRERGRAGPAHSWPAWD